jgi:hypothetical protein
VANEDASYVANEDAALANSEDLHNIAELQGKLRATESELERARKQRDYVLRLLRQQQTLSTLRGQNSMLVQWLSRTPGSLKDIVPLRFKQLVRRIAARIG